MENLLFKTEEARINKSFSNGLSYYWQEHCTEDLTDNGYRIYRTPNLTVSVNGQVMWGGLVLNPMQAGIYNFVKGHTYILAFHVKGKSSNAAVDVLWTNQVGWGGGGLDPIPSNVEYYNPVGENFNGEGDFWYKWTVTDDLYKVCTYSYSSFAEGNTYLSYAGFKFGFVYTDTGSMGTDLYITNIRMYDITDNPDFDISKEGIVSVNQLIEGPETKIMKTKDLITTNFIEI